LAWYMPAYMPNIHYVKFYVSAYANLYTCYSARISMPVDMLSSVYLLICQMLHLICCMLYAGCHMPRLVCRFLCVEYHVLAIASLQSNQLICLSQYQFLYAILYAGTWVPNIYCEMPSLLICQLQYTCIYMSACECQISVVRFQVSLYANLGCYISNCYLSVYMPSALFQELYAKCYGLYAKLHMQDCYMPNAMTIAMSFRMTTEQVGYFVIYMSITWLWLSILPL
jgi:hypothetical protein